MPSYQFDRKIGLLHLAVSSERVMANLRTYSLPIQLTKGSEIKLSGVKMPKYYVVAIFAADKPMTIRLAGIKDLALLPEMFAPVKAMIGDWMEEVGK